MKDITLKDTSLLAVIAQYKDLSVVDLNKYDFGIKARKIAEVFLGISISEDDEINDAAEQIKRWRTRIFENVR